MKTLENKVALITGGTSGIGRAISIKLAEQGARVLATYARQKQKADSLQRFASENKLAIDCIRGDLSNEESFQKVISEIKLKTDVVHILIHSAASGVHRDTDDLSLKQLQWTFDINFFAIHHLIAELITRIPKGGKIIGLSSAGAKHALPQYAAIGSSKAALESLFRHYAVEFAPRGIAVNLVCAGLVLTEALDAFPNKEQRISQALDRTPTKKLCTPEDVAHLIGFLCDPQTNQIVGQTLVIDGGQSILC
jgi:enoyl-[acyl-carrier protein] reductase III